MPAWGSSVETPYADPFDPQLATRNNRIREYNDVITKELSQIPGVTLGPDFYSCFLSQTTNRFSLFRDSLHPNALGYIFMAALWRDDITGNVSNSTGEACPSPIYILESLDAYRFGHKQNVLTVGDPYYTDESHQLDRVPKELESGIWVTQPNAQRTNQSEDFLTFDVGEATVSVYIAYDPAGPPPDSASHNFRAISLSETLGVSDERVRVFSTVVAKSVTGKVVIGGTRSNGDARGDQQAYVVVVVP